MACAAGLYCLVHSVLASRQAKITAARLFGGSACNAFYRIFFNVQSIVGFAVLAIYGRHLPDRCLYKVKGIGGLGLRIVQASGIAWAIWSARHAGMAELLGVKPMLQEVAGHRFGPAEAQGPRLDHELGVQGPFLASRHPLNFAPVPVFWATPRMTVNRLVFNILGTAYLVLGSMHEEARLKTSYGPVYERYTRSGVPFFLPDLRLLRLGAHSHQPGSNCLTHSRVDAEV
jgi:protein-S-isoprenylcysteine O-methyltransferase Ste14